IHFLWQGAAIAAVYAAARRATLTATASARYRIACTALLLIVAAPVATWQALRPASPIQTAIAPDRSARVPASPTLDRPVLALLPPTVRNAVPAGRPSPVLSAVVALWMFGAAAFWIRLLGGLAVASRVRSSKARPAGSDWQQMLDRLATRIGLGHPVRLLESAWIQAPAAAGWLRPVIFGPIGMLAGLPAEHVEALLLHELAHIRRRDYLVNVLQGIAEATLFYHPAVWWISGHIREEREACCDDTAVSLSGDRLAYAQLLVSLESCRAANLRAAVAANGGSLASRVARILGQPRPAMESASPRLVAIGLLLLAAACGLLAQSADRPVFQAASIKKNSETAPRRMGVRSLPGGGVTAQNAPLIMVIQNAYQVQAYQVV